MVDMLSRGAIATIMDGGNYADPVFQVLNVKKMGSTNSEKDKYRAYLSDGVHSVSFAIISAPVYHSIGEKGLTKNSIVKVQRYITNVFNNTRGNNNRALLILNLELLKDGDEVGETFGDPVPYVAGSKPAPPSNGATPSHSSEPAAKVPKLAPTNGNSSISTELTHPISSLSPYHNRWIIKARVMNKSEIKEWNNSRGSGKLFSVDLIDESGEIRCTAFRDQVDKFYSLIQVDKVYYISKCQLKAANKQFNSLKNDYEMSMTSETIVEECLDDAMPGLQMKFDFLDINKVAELENNALIDVIGVAKAVGDVQTIVAKSTGRELKKREVQLVDQSNTCITLTLWGSQAENFDGSGNPVVALKGARIGEFGGGKNLSNVPSTVMKINPDMKECFQLKGWYESVGMNMTANDISARTGGGGSLSTPWMCFKEASEQQLGSMDSAKGLYYQVKGTILLIRHENCLYKACPLPDCNKKVIDNNDGTYRCEKCNKSYENYKYRFLCSMNVGDWSGNQWVSMFNDEAEKVVGMTAQTAGQLLENNPTGFQEGMEKAHFSEFILKCRAKMESYNDEQRLKTVVVRVDPISYKDYNSQLIENIKRLSGL